MQSLEILGTNMKHQNANNVLQLLVYLVLGQSDDGDDIIEIPVMG